jgi:glutathione synthase
LDPKDSSIEKVEEVKAMIQRDAQHYVLKPQREGGGNNIYGEDILSAFKTMSAEELSAYILMEKILPPSQRSTLIRRGVALEALSVCELGIYSVYLSSTNHHSQPEEVTHMNSYSGYLLRVKAEDVSEGGVAAGFSVLSSVHLQN